MAYGIDDPVANRSPPHGGLLSSGGADAGFTLVELVVLMVIIGILAIAAIPRWAGSGSGFEERSFRDQLVAALRFAQKTAIASRRTVCANFSAAPVAVSFQISTTQGAVDCAVSSNLVLPASDASNTLTPTRGNVSFVTLPAGNVVIFYSSGRPNAGASATINNLDPSLAITVEAETGYVH